MLDYILKNMNRKPAATIKANAALLRDILFCSYLLRIHNWVSVEKCRKGNDLFMKGPRW